jgi:energy-coupling factor transporter ATP-binding protein EcfA2
VMVCAGAWLSAAISRPSPRRRLLLVDEAWALLNRPATTAWLQAVSKLARRHGVALITVVHRCSDLSGQADDGTAVQAQARGLLADAETRVVYGQPAGERAAVADLLDLSEVETELVTRLPAHRALWRIGGHTAVVEHVLTTDEAASLVDTDQRMTS